MVIARLLPVILPFKFTVSTPSPVVLVSSVVMVILLLPVMLPFTLSVITSSPSPVEMFTLLVALIVPFKFRVSASFPVVIVKLLPVILPFKLTVTPVPTSTVPKSASITILPEASKMELFSKVTLSPASKVILPPVVLRVTPLLIIM